MMFCWADQSPHSVHIATIAPIGRRLGVGAASGVSVGVGEVAAMTQDELVANNREETARRKWRIKTDTRESVPGAPHV